MNALSVQAQVRVRRGLTLVEVIVSLFLLVLGILGIGSAATYAAKVGRQSEGRGIALAIARHKLEELISVSQPNRALVTNQEFVIPQSLLDQLPGTSNVKSLQGWYTIQNVSGTKNLQQVMVTVKWRNQSQFGGTDKSSSVRLWKTMSSTANLNWTPYDGTTTKPIDQWFYTPPPPPPPAPPGNNGNTGNGGNSSSGNGSSQPNNSAGRPNPPANNSGGTANQNNSSNVAPWALNTMGSKWQ